MIRWRYPLAALALAAVACASLAGALRSSDRIRMPHARHAKAGVECLQCHEPIYDAAALEGRFLPAEDVCLACHKKEKESGNCGFCHQDPDRAAGYPDRRWTIRMSHAAHIERVEEDCSRCHAVLPEPGAEKRSPSMSGCLSCHEHREGYDRGACDTCHVDLLKYALEPVSAFSHKGDFLDRHRVDARSAGETCARCHDQSFCADCHAKTTATRVEIQEMDRPDRGFIHRFDFVSRHAMEAAADPARCQRCHGTSACESCHEAERLTPLASAPRNPHPPDWARVGSAMSHGREARRGIERCAACHDQGPRSICIDCHRVGGIGGSPHPPSWIRRHPRREIEGNGMCLYCHS